MEDEPGDVLARVRDWEPETVAIGVTRPSTTAATHGPVDHVLALASLTKPLTAYAVLVAVQDGLVHLDEPLDDATQPGATPRHLLAHASGLPLEEGEVGSEVARRRIYSNLGFERVARLVESRTDMTFAEHLDVEVLQPLGMTATQLRGSPAHGAHGTVTDLLAFARELLSPRLLDRELLDQATRVAFPGLDGVLPGYGKQSPNDWGLGFEIRGTKDPHWTGTRLSPATFGHFGRSGGFLWVDPTIGLGAATLSDLDFGPWAIEAWPDINDRIVTAFAPG